MSRSIGAIVLAIALAGPAAAHGDLHEQIAAVSAKIARSPNDPDLYLKRAELNRFHEDWTASEADYRRAERLAPTLFLVSLGRGKLYLARGKYAPALAELDKVIAVEPDHVDARVTRARIFALLARGQDAAADFSHAIALADAPEPDWYLERAQALASLAGYNINSALSGLDEGLAKLGPLPVLELYAVELEQVRGQVDAALVRLEIMRVQASRQETWWERIGDVQARAGRSAEAHASYANAQQSLLAVPEHLRNVPSMQALAARLRDKLTSPSEPPASVH